MSEQTTTVTTGEVVPRSGWRRILESAKVKTAIGGLSAMALTIITTEPTNIQRWREFGWAAVGTALALIGAWAYEDGKLKEGMVPEGYRAADGIGGVPMFAEVQSFDPNRPRTGPGPDIDPAADQPQKSPGVNVRGPGGITRLGCLAFATAALALSGGCQQTSKAFQVAITQGLPGVADSASGYVQRDATLTASDPAEAQRRTAEAAELKASASPPVTLERTERAWQIVRPWYAEYVRTDTRLAAVEIKSKMSTVESLDALIAAERKRKSKLIPGP